MSTAGSSTWYALRRVRGTFAETTYEFYCGDGFFLLLLIAAVPVVIAAVAFLTEMKIPPSKLSDWYPIGLLALTVAVLLWLVPRAGRTIVIDSNVISIRSRSGREIATIPLDTVTNAKIDLYTSEYGTSKTLVLVTSLKTFRTTLPKALEKEFEL